MANPVAFRSRLSAMEAPEAAGGPLFHDKDRSNSAPKVFTLLRVANGLARLLSAPSGLRFPRGRLAYPLGWERGCRSVGAAAPFAKIAEHCS